MTGEQLNAAGTLFMAYGAAIVLVALFSRWRIRTALRRAVFGNLDSAAENGYFEPGEYCHDMAADELAQDLTTYAADLEDERPETLTPYVVEWRNKRGLP